jgi:hypothetical protein
MWPRGLSAPLAAEYVGVSKTKFLAEVGKIWHRPDTRGGRKIWSRPKLDKEFDERYGDASSVRGAINDFDPNEIRQHR